MKYYDIFDFIKIILALFVVILHSQIFPFIFYPWVRIAVPIFFMISSFLLFSKINLSLEEEKILVIKKFVIRNLKLYVFWFILLLPVTIVLRWSWFNSGVLIGLITTLKNFIFSSTFAVSWFISALVWGVLIIYKFSNSKNYKCMTLFCLAIYIICCLKSSYFSFFSECYILKQIYVCYTAIMPSPIFSFPAALIWIMLGKLFADNKINILNQSFYLLIMVISAILLYLEWKFIYLVNFSYQNDCYIFLIPFAFAIFGIIKNIDIKIKNAVMLRKISTIFYCMHLSVILASKFFIKILHISLNLTTESIVLFIIAIAVCSLVSFIILKFENKKGCSILKYSH